MRTAKHQNVFLACLKETGTSKRKLRLIGLWDWFIAKETRAGLSEEQLMFTRSRVRVFGFLFMLYSDHIKSCIASASTSPHLGSFLPLAEFDRFIIIPETNTRDTSVACNYKGQMHLLFSCFCFFFQKSVPTAEGNFLCRASREVSKSIECRVRFKAAPSLFFF